MQTEATTTMTHVAGPCIQFGSLQRQRCSWCGFVLVDDDLANMAFPIPPCRWCNAPWNNSPQEGECQRSLDGLHQWGEITPPSGFPFEQFIEVTVSGGFRGSSLVESEPEADGSVKVPENCCMRLPAELTGRVGGES